MTEQLNTEHPQATPRPPGRRGRWSAALVVSLAVTTVGLTQTAQATAACSPASSLSGSYRVLVFTSTTACDWSVPAGITAADVLVVAGGGAAGLVAAGGLGSGPGVGGAGGLVYRTAGNDGGTGGQATLTPGSPVSVQVGAGGVGQGGNSAGNDGGNSTFGDLPSAVGGGGGGSGGAGSTDGRPGGSGGGGGRYLGVTPTVGGTGVTGQGHAGGAPTSACTFGGGGGGAGTAASGTTAGGGQSVAITGTTLIYALGGYAYTSWDPCPVSAAARSHRARTSDLKARLSPSLAGYGNGGGADNNVGLPGQAGIVVVRYLASAETPNTPGTPVAVGGNSQATVSFAAPVGGLTPSSYTVRVAAPGDTSKTCTVSLSSVRSTRLRAAIPTPPLSCVVTGLTNGRSYTFEVKASNGSDSPWSAPSTLITLDSDVLPAPNAPASVTAVAGTASVVASWTAVNGATGYTATAGPGPSTCTTTGTTSCVLGAVAGTTYTVTVVARSGNGTSAASAPSNAVTPVEPVVPAAVPPSAPITLTTDKGQISLATPGQQIVVVGTGFAAYSTATVILYSTPTDLGNVTTDASGNFAVPVTVPAGLAAGSHTFLATGVDPAGGTRQMVLPVTVAPTDSGSTGGGTDPQTGTLPVPTGGTITLLDADGLATTLLVVPNQGTYALDTLTGIISFVPVVGFVGTADPVTYRITDAIGTVVTGTYTAIVTSPAAGDPSAGEPTVKLPVRLVATTGRNGSVPVPCRISRGAISHCRITATAMVSGRRIVVGHGLTTPKATQDLLKVSVKVSLNALGRSLSARPGGVRLSFTAVVGQRGRTGTTSAIGATEVLAQKYTLARSIRFGSNSAEVGAADTRYLKATRAKLAGAKAITCTGHADSRGTAAAALRLGTRRAKAACHVLAGRRKIVVIIVSKGEKAPTGKNDTAAGRARNRRVDITVRN